MKASVSLISLRNACLVCVLILIVLHALLMTAPRGHSGQNSGFIINGATWSTSACEPAISEMLSTTHTSITEPIEDNQLVGTINVLLPTLAQEVCHIADAPPCYRVSKTNSTVFKVNQVNAFLTGVVDPALPLAVSMDVCWRFASAVQLISIYHKFDAILKCAQRIAASYPNSTLVVTWPEYPPLLQNENGDEIRRLWQYLTEHYFGSVHSILVVKEPQELLRWHSQKGSMQLAQHLGHHIRQLCRGTSPREWLPLLAQVQARRWTQYVPGSLPRTCSPLLLTRKYDARCHPPESLRYPLLVTGLGGAGTHYVAKKLSAQGWAMKHEELGEDGSVSWFYAANDRTVGAKYPYGELPVSGSGVLSPRFAHVVHVVRDPMAQISSFTAHSNKTYHFALRALQHLVPYEPNVGNASAVLARLEKAHELQHQCLRGERCHLEFAARTWVHWNRFVHSFAEATFRVDQVNELLHHVCWLAGDPSSPLRVRPRYCEVKGCPVVRTTPQAHAGILGALQGQAFQLADQVLGLCKINDALYRRSAAHKRHLQYSLEDVRRLDSLLAEDIEREAGRYGLKVG